MSEMTGRRSWRIWSTTWRLPSRLSLQATTGKRANRWKRRVCTYSRVSILDRWSHMEPFDFTPQNFGNNNIRWISWTSWTQWLPRMLRLLWRQMGFEKMCWLALEVPLTLSSSSLSSKSSSTWSSGDKRRKKRQSNFEENCQFAVDKGHTYRGTTDTTNSGR